MTQRQRGSGLLAFISLLAVVTILALSYWVLISVVFLGAGRGGY